MQSLSREAPVRTSTSSVSVSSRSQYSVCAVSRSASFRLSARSRRLRAQSAHDTAEPIAAACFSQLGGQIVLVPVQQAVQLYNADRKMQRLFQKNAVLRHK